jgi:hypothetical protein
MWQHVLSKAIEIAQSTLQHACDYREQPQDEEDVQQQQSVTHNGDLQLQRREIQASIARITELGLIFLDMMQQLQPSSSTTTPPSLKDSSLQIIQMYVEFQRKTLRHRCKPAIAKLVHERQKGTFHPVDTHSNKQNHNSTPQHAVILPEDDNHEEDETAAACMSKQSLQQQYHAPVFTIILGETAALIHPLAAWYGSISSQDNHNHHPHTVPPQNPIAPYIRQLCLESILVLDEQAQTLAHTVSNWFWEDRKQMVDYWMEQSTTTTATSHRSELAMLDALVEEMAYICQVMERYDHLMTQISHFPWTTSTTIRKENSATTATTKKEDMLPVWTWKYGALERSLAIQQYATALQHATPVTIVLGTNIWVPSIVEDAQYLSTRALQRASTTRCAQAVATVAYAISHDVWSTETTILSNDTSDPSAANTVMTVYQALLNRMGCWQVDQIQENTRQRDAQAISGTNSHHRSPPHSSAFASALLDALDDDMRGVPVSPSTKKVSTPAPASGNFLAALGLDSTEVRQRERSETMCLCNGIYAAHGASQTLVNLLEELLEPGEEDEEGGLVFLAKDERAMSMIQLAREELSRYSHTYERLLNETIQEALERFCGSKEAVSTHLAAGRSKKKAHQQCLVSLKHFFETENFQIDGIDSASEDERLENELLKVLRQCEYLQQLREKCEGPVVQLHAEHLAKVLVEIVLQVLWHETTEGSTGTSKTFTDWGSLLLSKEVRLLQGFISNELLEPSMEEDARYSGHVAKLFQVWERLSQVVTVLQLERPSDWLAYHLSSVLTPDELLRTMSLRTDFSTDAIQSVVASVTPKMEVPIEERE